MTSTLLKPLSLVNIGSLLDGLDDLVVPPAKCPPMLDLPRFHKTSIPKKHRNVTALLSRESQDQTLTGYCLANIDFIPETKP